MDKFKDIQERYMAIEKPTQMQALDSLMEFLNLFNEEEKKEYLDEYLGEPFKKLLEENNNNE